MGAPVTNTTKARIGAGTVWLLLVASTFFAPPTRPDMNEWVWALLVGETAGENPSMVAFFQAMGLWPWIWASLLVDELLPAEHPRHWRDRVPALPFVLLANVGGMFLLAPYLILRDVGRPPAKRRAWLAWLGHPVVAGLWALAGVGLLWTAIGGDLIALRGTIRVEGFAFIMSFDFLAFWVLSLGWLTARLGVLHAGWFPLIGSALGALQLAVQRRASGTTR